jgi:O-antigen/teichoic acid export membrane protein
MGIRRSFRRGHLSTTPVTSETRSIWRHVRRDALLLGFGSIGIVVAQMAFRSVALAALPASEYGRLTLVLSLYNTVMIIGASGLPNSAARYVSAVAPHDDEPVVASARRAALLPVVIATVATAALSAILLHSLAAAAVSCIGLPSLVYSLLAGGILRGRHHLVAAAAIQPVAAATQVALLVAVVASGYAVGPLDAFVVFCFGNLIGFGLGAQLVRRSRITRRLSHEVLRSPALDAPSPRIPTPREFLAFSMWLASATVAITLLPLVMRAVAALDSYTVVAVIDVALVLLTIPQRVGAVIVQAVIPHATRAAKQGGATISITWTEHLWLVIPFVMLAVVLAVTPAVTAFFDWVGKPEYGQSADYLAIAVLAAPARILYGVVQGVLVAHGEGRFIALNAWFVTGLAGLVMLALALIGGMVGAFATFSVACWVIYLSGFHRTRRIEAGAT